MENRKGPRMDPWGTPQATSALEEEGCPTETECSAEQVRLILV